MANKIIFTSLRVNSANKNNELKVDEDGYYEITLGALNTFNSAGDFYDLDAAKNLFLDSSVLMRRIKGGHVFAEAGHPKPLPGQTYRDYLARILRIEESNICAHIKEVWLVHTDVTDAGTTKKKVLIMGKVKPMGALGKLLKDNLDTPDANCAFSIRSLTNDTIINGINVKAIQQIVNWDWVVEPGISVATQWKTLGIESRDMLSIDLDDRILCQELTNELNEAMVISNENDKELLRDVLKDISIASDSKNNSIAYRW